MRRAYACHAPLERLQKLAAHRSDSRIRRMTRTPRVFLPNIPLSPIRPATSPCQSSAPHWQRGPQSHPQSHLQPGCTRTPDDAALEPLHAVQSPTVALCYPPLQRSVTNICRPNVGLHHPLATGPLLARLFTPNALPTQSDTGAGTARKRVCALAARAHHPAHQNLQIHLSTPLEISQAAFRPKSQF